MLKYYIISTIRNLRKRPFFLLINVIGLTLAVLISTIIAIYVHNELSTDDQLAKSENIYRVLRKSNRNNENYSIGVTSGPYAEALTNDYPVEIDEAIRVFPSDGLLSVNEETHINEEFFYFADADFFGFFNYEFLYGDEQTAFDNPQSIILMDDVATRLFGEENPLNKTIKLDDSFEFIITGVIKRPRHKSHMNFNLIARSDQLESFSFIKDWWSNGLITYIKLNEMTNPVDFESKLPLFMDKYLGKDFARSGRRTDLTLQPINQIYFDNSIQYDQYVHGNKATVYIFLWIGIFLVVIACINFINITTSVSSLRAKEVGVRKILGSNKKQLLVQYLSETFAICAFSVITGFMLVEILLPGFNGLYHLNLQIYWTDPLTILYALSIVIILVLLSGIYPALLLSSFNPLKVINARSNLSGKTSVSIRKGLVIFQFSCSILLLIATLVIWQQMNFIINKPLGFDKSNVVLIENNNEELRNNIDRFTDRVERIPGVKSVTRIVGEPGGFHDTMVFQKEGEEGTITMRTAFCDAEYKETFDISVVTGRFFRKDNPVDRERAVIINETAVKRLGFSSDEEALGKRIKNQFFDTLYREIIGVVKDYNFTSLKNDIEPLVIAPTSNGRMIAIKIDRRNMSDQLYGIEKEYKRIVALYPFEYQFEDAKIRELYAEEETQKNIFILFSMASIFIGCLGMLGLATFTANQRAREISIRKVLGASIFNISYMLTNQFIKLVLVANLIAWPLAWYFSDSWLSRFAYRIDLSLVYFLLATGATILIAIAAVAYQSVRAALANPVETLKAE